MQGRGLVALVVLLGFLAVALLLTVVGVDPVLAAIVLAVVGAVVLLFSIAVS